MGRYIGFDEFAAGIGDNPDMSASVFAPELKRYIDRVYPNFKFARSGGDPAGQAGEQATEQTPFRILNANGLGVIQPTHTNSTMIRRAALTNPLKRLCMDGKPAFMISPKAKVWRKGLMGGFKYRRKLVVGDARYHDEPDKNEYSHICEAGEYGLLAGGEGHKVIVRASASNADRPIVAKVSINVFD